MNIILDYPASFIQTNVIDIYLRMSMKNFRRIPLQRIIQHRNRQIINDAGGVGGSAGGAGGITGGVVRSGSGKRILKSKSLDVTTPAMTTKPQTQTQTQPQPQPQTHPKLDNGYYLGYVPRNVDVEKLFETDEALDNELNVLASNSHELMIYRLETTETTETSQHTNSQLTNSQLTTSQPTSTSHIRMCVLTTPEILERGVIELEGVVYKLLHLIVWTYQTIDGSYCVWTSLKDHTHGYDQRNIRFHTRPRQQHNTYEYSELALEEIKTGRRINFISKREIEEYLGIRSTSLDRRFGTESSVRDGYKGYRLHVRRQEYHVEKLLYDDETGVQTSETKVFQSLASIGMFWCFGVWGVGVVGVGVLGSWVLGGWGRGCWGFGVVGVMWCGVV